MKTMSTIAVRRDRNAVTLFSRKDGTKIRFALGNYEKASRPELVDIKITDFCPAMCAFCYQGSTLQGRHGSMENMETIVRRLADAKVFEVALGGGEPLYHPEVVTILQMFHDAGVVPNFTTKFPALVRKNWGQIGHLIGGFAYSAENEGQVQMAARTLKGYVPDEKVSLHYVMGLGDKEHFKDYMRAASNANYRVTLLGYKTVGRGKDVIPHPYDWWIDAVNELVKEGNCPTLSIDTPLAEQYDGKMPIPSFMYHTREGAFSMYIDAVSMEMGASSFEQKPSLVPFDEDWIARYARI